MTKFIVDLSFLDKIKSQDLLTFGALVLAYFAYSKSIDDKYDSWKSLLLSLKADLDSQSQWLSTEYREESYRDKTAFSPRKIIFPLTFESLQEIIRRGASDFNFSDEFINKISIFNERIDTFNKLLEQQRLTVSANSDLTQRTSYILDRIGALDAAVLYEDFINSFKKLRDSNPDCYNLAERIFTLNKTIHVDIISNANNKSGLHNIYSYLQKEINTKIDNSQKLKPWYIRFRWAVLIVTIIIFFFVEAILK